MRSLQARCYPRSDGHGWQVVYYLRGSRKRETFKNRLLARNRVQEINYNLTTYGHPDPHKEWHGGTDATINEILDKYLSKITRKGLSPKTIQSYKGHASKMRKEWGLRRLDEINADFLEKWSDDFKAKGYSARYENHMVRLLGQAVKSLGIDYNPSAGFDGRKIELGEPEYYSLGDVRKILQTVFPRFRTVIAVQLFTGIRPSEAANLTEESIHKEEKLIVVKGKMGRRIVEDVPDTVWEWLDIGWYDATNYTRQIAQLRRDLASKDISWIQDGLRHTFATYHVAMTDAVKTAKIGGWKNPYTLHNHYVGVARRANGEEFFSITPESLPDLST